MLAYFYDYRVETLKNTPSNRMIFSCKILLSIYFPSLLTATPKTIIQTFACSPTEQQHKSLQLMILRLSCRQCYNMLIKNRHQKPSRMKVVSSSWPVTITVSLSPTSGLTCTAGSNVHSSRGTKSSRDHRGPSRGGGVVGQGGDMMLRFIQDVTDSVPMFLPSSHFQPRWTLTLSKSPVGLVLSHSRKRLWSCRCTCKIWTISINNFDWKPPSKWRAPICKYAATGVKILQTMGGDLEKYYSPSRWGAR